VGPAAQVTILAAGSVVASGVGLVVAGWQGWTWPGAGLAVAAATGVCLPAAVATLLLAEAVRRQTPQFGPVAVLAGTAVRMVVAVVGVVLLAGEVSRHGTPRDQFARWVAYSYVVTLAIECGLLMAAEGRTSPGASP
jgi:hypothetical protein